MDDARLEETIQKTQAKLLILDPMQAYLGDEVDMNRANEVRGKLKHLTALAERQQCTVLLIGHMNKGGSKAAYRGLGSIDFQAAARSVLIVGTLPDKPNLRIMAHGKSSLTPLGTSLSFTIENGTLHFSGTYDITADELLSINPVQAKQEQAKAFLQTFLAGGAEPATDVIARAAALGISKRTLDTTKSNLGVKSMKQENAWLWTLPK